MTLYNIHTCGEGYMVGKFDEDINVLGTYIIEMSEDDSDNFVCDCPSWPRKANCKHCAMLRIFIAHNKIDTAEFYNPDTKSWHRPLAPIEPEPDDTPQPGRYDDGTAFHPAFGPIKRRF